MGWYGDFQIQYKGNNPKKFHKLAKMIIPNSIMRFDFDDCNITENSVDLACTRSLSWYSADEDMKKIMSYLSKEDMISMQIDGEGEYEEIEIRKNDNEIILSNSNEESERYGSDDIGIVEMLYESLSPRYANEEEEIDICSLDGYIKFIANTFAKDKELLPIVQSFMYEVLDKDRINASAWDEEDKLPQKECDKLDKLRNNFESIESTSNFLNEQKDETITFTSGKKQSIEDLPDWAQQYPKSVINTMGGANLLKQLIDKQGKEIAKDFINFFAGSIMEEKKENKSSGHKK